MNLIYKNIIGIFIFDEKFSIKDSIDSKDIEKNSENKLIKKYKAIEPNEEQTKKILAEFKKPIYSKRYHDINLKFTKESIKKCIGEEFLIIEAISNIDDITKSMNSLTKRLREWFALNNPEYENKEHDNPLFIKNILLNKIPKKESPMGANLSKEDLQPITNLAKSIESLDKLRFQHEKYLESIMSRYCPNLKAVAGTIIGARLIVHGRSLKRLVMLPASTIQLLGAEHALFRHLKTGARAPRHGLIIADPLLVSAPQNMHGKIARNIADKISIAVKIDYFKGEFIGDKLRKELENKFKK
ncbi:hypothetical protein ACFLZX_03165 [Nanoarchaeota archaeon]